MSHAEAPLPPLGEEVFVRSGWGQKRMAKGGQKVSKKERMAMGRRLLHCPYSFVTVLLLSLSYALTVVTLTVVTLTVVTLTVVMCRKRDRQHAATSEGEANVAKPQVAEESLAGNVTAHCTHAACEQALSQKDTQITLLQAQVEKLQLALAEATNAQSGALTSDLVRVNCEVTLLSPR